MGISGPVDFFEHDLLTANPALAALYDRSAAEGEIRMRRVSDALPLPPWPGVTSPFALHRAAVEAELVAILADYAVAARPLLSEGDVTQWRALVHEAQVARGAGMLADEILQSTVGASLLRDRLGGPTPAPLRGARVACSCGFAVTGTLPARLCRECGDLLLRRWVAEERRVLAGIPRYALAVTHIIEETASRQRMAIAVPGSFVNADAAAKRRWGGRRLARLARRHRADLDGLPLERWRELASLVAHDTRTVVQVEATATARRGLGAAGLTELGLLTGADLARRANSIRILPG